MGAVTVPMAMYRDLLDKYDSLVREVMAMKRDGFLPAIGGDLTPRPEPELEPEIVKAITDVVDQTDGESDLERHLTEQAWRLKRSGLGVEDIAQRISDGEPVPA